MTTGTLRRIADETPTKIPERTSRRVLSESPIPTETSGESTVGSPSVITAGIPGETLVEVSVDFLKECMVKLLQKFLLKLLEKHSVVLLEEFSMVLLEVLLRELVMEF